MPACRTAVSTFSAYDGNKVVSVTEFTGVIGASGFVDIPVTLRRTLTEGGLNYFTAVIDETDGRTTNLSNVIRVALTTLPPGSNSSQPPSELRVAVAPTPLAGDYDHNDMVDDRDYASGGKLTDRRIARWMPTAMVTGRSTLATI